MPIVKSAKKAVKSSAKKRVFNDRRRRAMKETTKKINNFISDGKKDDAQKALPSVQKSIDKAVKNGVIKKNTGARKKARIAKAVKNIS